MEKDKEEEISYDSKDISDLNTSNKHFKLNNSTLEKEQPVTMPSFRLEISWTPSQKAKAIDLLKEKSVIQVFHHFDQKIPYDTLRTWKSNKRVERKKGSGRKPTSEELDQMLFDWFIDARTLKFPVDNRALRMKA